MGRINTTEDLTSSHALCHKDCCFALKGLPKVQAKRTKQAQVLAEG
jgi:hypothetical protein